MARAVCTFSNSFPLCRHLDLSRQPLPVGHHFYQTSTSYFQVANSLSLSFVLYIYISPSINNFQPQRRLSLEELWSEEPVAHIRLYTAEFPFLSGRRSVVRRDAGRLHTHLWGSRPRRTLDGVPPMAAMRTRARARVCVCACTCMRVRVFVCMYVHTCARVCVCARACVERESWSSTLTRGICQQRRLQSERALHFAHGIIASLPCRWCSW